MGLFDFLKTKEKASGAEPAATEPAPSQARKPYLGDLEKTQELYALVDVPDEGRDAEWNAAFLSAIPTASFRCGNPQVIQGPDGFPYVQLLLPEPGVGFQCYVIERMKDDFLLERGLGVVVNPTSSTGPDWVLTYGDILNFHLSGHFYTTDETPFSKQVHDEVIAESEAVLVGQPAELLLPIIARNVLSAFLKENGVASPKLALLMRKTGNGSGVSQDLAFNITPEDFETEADCRRVMQQLAWFLPRHYSIVGLAESAMESGFAPL